MQEPIIFLDIDGVLNCQTFFTEQFYSKNIILKYLKTTKERISNEVCAMVAKRYNVPTFARFKQI